MRRKDVLSIVLMVGVLFLMISITKWVSQANGATIEIEYKYDSRAICVGARATMDGILVGKAYLEDLVKGEYYLVRETHYSPRTGAVVYEVLSKFAIGGGMKIGETRISGQKLMEIFRSWPWR